MLIVVILCSINSGSAFQKLCCELSDCSKRFIHYNNKQMSQIVLVRSRGDTRGNQVMDGGLRLAAKLCELGEPLK
jgi:hypothetical protein